MKIKKNALKFFKNNDNIENLKEKMQRKFKGTIISIFFFCKKCEIPRGKYLKNLEEKKNYRH